MTTKRLWQAGVAGVMVAATAGTVALAADVVSGTDTGAARTFAVQTFANGQAPLQLASENERDERREYGEERREERGEHRSGDDDGRTATGSVGVEGAIRAVTDAGYSDIREVEREGPDYEVKARDADGRWWELYVDARTGEIVHRERD